MIYIFYFPLCDDRNRLPAREIDPGVLPRRSSVPRQVKINRQNTDPNSYYLEDSYNVSSYAGGQANGGTQNQGNILGDKSSTRLFAPPGGSSSFSLAHDTGRFYFFHLFICMYGMYVCGAMDI